MTDDPTELAIPTEPSECDVAEDVVDFATKKRRIVLMLIAYSLITGVILVFLPEERTPIGLAIWLPFLILGILWCHTDASARNHRIGGFLKVMLVLMFAIGFPVYVFQTRGLRGCQTLALAMLLVACMLACVCLAVFATLYVGEVIGWFKFAD